jgi:uncharacterized protein (DUF433 family)
MIIKDINMYNDLPIIKGTRILVSVILANIRDGVTFDKISKEYGIRKDDILDCIDYAIEEVNK